MFAEIGVFALCWALVFALLLIVIPTIGLYKHKDSFIYSAPTYIYSLFFCILISYICLTICFLIDDFSVIYILKNSSMQLPWFYKFCAVWAGHEGSMLLWVFILSFWMLLVGFLSKQLNIEFKTRVYVILGLLCFGFILFILTTSNPFLRQFQVFGNNVGRDLNPLLQDPGFLFHPPMLYMGYVGFSVAFSFAISALWLGKLDSTWAKWTRPWTLGAWCCLTAGITLGSWWAYRELGWGGFWFWDPVENASFMPWLVGTGLIHSLIMVEKRKQFISWTILMAICAFSLSLIGTFLVRSGVLTSVHAFAVDPLRGMYILIFLCITIGGSLLLFTLNAHKLQTKNKPHVISRESSLLLNNVFFAVAMLIVLMGTVYPLLIDALGLGKLSVGAPYFNTVFVYIMMPMLLLMGFGIHVRWQYDSLHALIKNLGWILCLSLIFPWVVTFIFFKNSSILIILSLFLGFWIVLSLIKKIISTKQLFNKSRTYWGMIISHFGVAIFVFGVAISNGYGILQDVKLAPGEEHKLGDHLVKFVQEEDIKGPNYHGVRATFSVISSGLMANIYPEKRIYNVSQIAMTDAAIDAGLFRDIYIALGEPLDGNAWSVRMYYKPLIRFIWLGGFLILFGGLFALTDKKYYQKSLKQKSKPNNF